MFLLNNPDCETGLPEERLLTAKERLLIGCGSGRGSGDGLTVDKHLILIGTQTGVTFYE